VLTIIISDNAKRKQVKHKAKSINGAMDTRKERSYQIPANQEDLKGINEILAVFFFFFLIGPPSR
jgi:hypothetical protein